MNEISRVTEADIATLAAWISERRDYISNLGKSEEDLRPTALKVIHCVLSLGRSYDRFVKPRLNAFMEKHPNIQKVADLAYLMDSFQSPKAFLQQELNYNHGARAYTLQSVVKFVCKVVEEMPNVSEEDVLKQWAIQAKPQECFSLNIKGFKIAGFQYLRMLFGADTVKPDVHVHRCISELLDRNVSDLEAILLLEEASKREGLSVRSVDKFIWNRGARSEAKEKPKAAPKAKAEKPEPKVIAEGENDFGAAKAAVAFDALLKEHGISREELLIAHKAIFG